MLLLAFSLFAQGNLTLLKRATEVDDSDVMLDASFVKDTQAG